MSADARRYDPARARVAQGPRPHYFRDPDVDRLWTVVLALMGEVSMLRDRLDAHERLLGSPIAPADVDAYAPDAEAEADRGGRRTALVERVLRSITLEMEGLGRDRPGFREEEE